MRDYEPSTHCIPLRDIVTAWVVALVAITVLLALPECVRKVDDIGAEVGMKAAIGQTIPRYIDLMEESRPSP